MKPPSKPGTVALPLACCLAIVPPLLMVDIMVIAEWHGIPWCALGDGWAWWSASYLALHGQIATVFTPAAISLWVDQHTGCGPHMWSYPPPMLLLVMPLGFLPPVPAVMLFDVLGVAWFGRAIRLAGITGGLWAALMFSPVMVFNLFSQQNGAWTGGLFIAGVALSERRPLAGGVLLGLLVAKPQLWVLMPMFLIGRRNYRALAAMLVMVGFLALATVAVFSFQSWALFLSRVVPTMGNDLNLWAAPHHSHQIVTVFALARWLGVGVGWSKAIQAVFTVAALLGALWLGRRDRLDQFHRWAYLGILSVLATPFMQNYDLFPATFGCGVLLRGLLATQTVKYGRAEAIVIAALWIIPGLTPWLALEPVPSVAPLLVLAILGFGGRRLWTTEAIGREINV